MVELGERPGEVEVVVVVVGEAGEAGEVVVVGMGVGVVGGGGGGGGRWVPGEGVPTGVVAHDGWW